MGRSLKEKAQLTDVKLTFNKNYNYDSCYIIGKFRLYTYKDEEKFEADCTIVKSLTLFHGLMSDYKDLFWDFMNYMKVAYAMGPADIQAEVLRVGMAATESYKKFIDSEKTWFRITFNEQKYVPGQLPKK